MKLHRRALLGLAFIGAGAATAESGPLVAAASDLKFVLDDLAREFLAATGIQVRLSYGSSGNFYRQITQGAPFELFLSADEDLVLKLSEQSLTVDRGVVYGTGRIVLFVPRGSPISADENLADVARALKDGRLVRFAIANPQHAPYGRAAMQALQTLGLWETIQPALVLGENVSQAAQFITTGATQAGIFAYSLALATALANQGRFVLIPQALHAPLRQRMALAKEASPAAREFYLHLQRPRARAAFRRYGFELPGDASK